MKRIVIFSAFLTPFRSGAEACAEEVAVALHDRYDITIVTARMRRTLPARDQLQGNVPIVRVGIGAPIDKWLFPFLAPFAARRLQPSIIHAVLESYAGLAMLLCRWLVPSAKRILTCQSTNTSWFLRSMHTIAHRVTVISVVLQKRAIALGRNDAVLIPNGMHFLQFRTACAAVKKVEGRVLYVGRLEAVKGVDTLLRAVALLHADVRPQMHIVGSGSQSAALERLVTKLDVEHSVTFLGRLDGKALLTEYAEAEIFCGLSRSEAMGNVFLEAQAAECAVIATNVGGIPDIVQDGKTGVLVRPDDAEQAAAMLQKLLLDRDWLRTLAAAGPRNAEKYDWGILAEMYAKIYILA